MHTLEKRLNYTFENKELLERALYHSSYANEHRGGFGSNERLEFLGDAVLGMVTADYLFHRHPDLPEGDLTRIGWGWASILSSATARSSAAAESARPSSPTRRSRSLRRSISTAAWSRRGA